ncbi:MAG: peptide chain release factor N(5)-glutamine methyltransferase [Bryobacteraceae bacterium]
MDIRTALLEGARALERESIAVPRLTAEVLLCHVLGRERAYLAAHPERALSQDEREAFEECLKARLEGRPTQYITGKQEFYGREFRVTPDVLIPRPETEHVVEAAVRLGARRVLDVGSGSGILAVTMQLETGAEAWGSDISLPALRVAAENARRLGARVRWVACDLAAAFTAGSMDLVVSNPPYVPLKDEAGLQREVRDWEPRVALFGGPAGVEIYGRLVEDAARVLRRGGWLVVELGFGTSERVAAMVRGWAEARVMPDLAGIPRVLAARK